MKGMWVATIACGVPAFLCSGVKPESQAEAEEWARIRLPPEAQDVRYDGECFMDCLIHLRFELPDRATVDRFAAQVGCTFEPTLDERGRPRRDLVPSEWREGDPEWWSPPAAGPHVEVCKASEPGATSRTVTADLGVTPATVFYSFMSL